MKKDNKETKTKQCTIPSVSGSAYLAFMRMHYEGMDEGSMKLFKSKTEAGKYICELRKKYGSSSVDYDIIDLHCH